MQFFTTLILLAPAMVNAIPAVSQRDTATSNAVYTYTIPDEYLAAHPDAPATVEFNQAQFEHFASLFPTEVTSTNEVVVTGEMNTQHMETGQSLNVLSEQSFWGKIKCTACKAGCGLLSGPLASAACVAICVAKVC